MPANTILLVISVITFSITIGTLVWRMSRLNSQCESNKGAVEKAHQRIDKLDDKQEHKIDSLAEQVKNLEKVQVRMDEKLNLLIKMEKGKLTN